MIFTKGSLPFTFVLKKENRTWKWFTSPASSRRYAGDEVLVLLALGHLISCTPRDRSRETEGGSLSNCLRSRDRDRNLMIGCRIDDRRRNRRFSLLIGLSAHKSFSMSVKACSQLSQLPNIPRLSATLRAEEFSKPLPTRQELISCRFRSVAIDGDQKAKYKVDFRNNTRRNLAREWNKPP
jgi:hypothetical protein